MSSGRGKWLNMPPRGESVVAVKGTCLIVVVGAIEVVVGVTTTVEVELLLSG